MGRKSGTTASFIEKAKAVHGERYDYSLVEYEYALAKVRILCHKHGVFEQKPSNHLNSQGCPLCVQKWNTSTKEYFIEKAKTVHEGRYGYSLVRYKNSWTKVKLICGEHGVFKQAPSAHLRGQNCPKCSGKHRPTTEEFIEKAKLVHEESYGYSLVEYKSTHTKVKLLCHEHGVFEQTPHNHLTGRGCPSCAATGYNPERPGSVYLLANPESIKVGITNKPVQKRLTDINSTTECKFNMEMAWSFADGSVAPKVERVVLAVLRAKYKNPAKKFDGYTETFVTTDVSFVASTIDAVVSSINK